MKRLNYIVNMVSTWNERCGIAYYTRELVKELSKYVNVNIIKVETKPKRVRFNYFLNLAKKAKRGCSLIHIQHEFAFFEGCIFKKYFNYMNMIPFFLRLFYLKKPKLIMTMHKVPEWDKPARTFISGLWRRLLIKLIFKCSDYIIVHNNYSKEELIKLGAKKDRIFVIPHGTVKLMNLPNKEECKRRLNLVGRKVLTLFGFITPSKGYEMALEALKKLPNEFILLIAGAPRTKEDREYCEKLKTIVSKLGLNDRVIFYGFIPYSELPIILGATDLGLLPYIVTTESGVLHTLLAYKLPILTSSLKPFKEIKASWNCIETFNSLEDLIKKIKWLLSDKEELSRLLSNAERFCLKTEWMEVAKKHLILYYFMLEHPDELYLEKRQKSRVSWLKDNAKGKILDVGCATGYISKEIKATAGIDLRKDRLLIAKSRSLNTHFLLSDALHLPFRERCFETVVLAELLEHIPFEKAKEALAEAVRVSSSIVLITLPNASKPGYDRCLVENPEHLWFPTDKNVNELMHGYNFEKYVNLTKDFWVIRVNV